MNFKKITKLIFISSFLWLPARLLAADDIVLRTMYLNQICIDGAIEKAVGGSLFSSDVSDYQSVERILSEAVRSDKCHKDSFDLIKKMILDVYAGNHLKATGFLDGLKASRDAYIKSRAMVIYLDNSEKKKRN